jgi:hypothetical protein
MTAPAPDYIGRHRMPHLTPSADVPACLDEDPDWQALMALAYPEPPADDPEAWVYE